MIYCWNCVSASFWIGLALALASGVTSGGCMLPMKWLRRWKWENMWLVFSIVALVALPWSLAMLLIPNLRSVYSSVSVAHLMAPVLFGAGWGIAQILFGLTIARLGLAVGYAIVMGCVAVLGTLAPLVFEENEQHQGGLLVFSGIALMAVGIAASGWAGRLREKACDPAQSGGRSTPYWSALALAVACGVVSPMLNYSFAFSGEIRAAAVRFGASPTLAGYAVWPIALSAGFVPNLLYSLRLLSKNETWKLFRFGFADAGLATAMGVVWMGSLALYGMCAARLGTLGTSLGWGIVQVLALITAAVVGLLTREWMGVPRSVRRIQSVALSLLILATVLMATATAFRS